MFCNFCGKAIQDDANLCAYCGRRVASTTGRQRLIRPRADRKIAGVCAGFAEYFGTDVTLIRLIVILLGIFVFPLAEIGYVIAWIVMPEEPEFRAYLPVSNPNHVTNPQG